MLLILSAHHCWYRGEQFEDFEYCNYASLRLGKEITFIIYPHQILRAVKKMVGALNNPFDRDNYYDIVLARLPAQDVHGIELLPQVQ